MRAALTPRSRAVLVVHPNNPTGSFVKPREAAELAEICAAREMAIVADEVFLDYGIYASGARLRRALHHAPQIPAHTFALHSEALTFTLSGLSKISLLPQMKLAWTVVSGPEAVVQTAVDRLEIIADTYLSPSTPVQLALPKFLSLRLTLQAQLQQRISANLSVLDSMLRESKPLARLDREGGWYAILRVRSRQRMTTSPLRCSNAVPCWSTPATSSIFRGKVFSCLASSRRSNNFRKDFGACRSFLAEDERTYGLSDKSLCVARSGRLGQPAYRLPSCR